MDIRQIRYFIHVAGLRSFSKAAKVLNVAQPSVSRQIQTLEEELHTQLLFRTTRGVEPTEAGLVLLRMGREFCKASMRCATPSAQCPCAQRETCPSVSPLPCRPSLRP